MKKTQIIAPYLSVLSLDAVERYLIWLFIEQKSIDFKKSRLLREYLGDYNGLNMEFKNTLEFESIKDLENYLELIIPEVDRKINGAFFTPTYVVDFIINEVSPKSSDKCLDPSCGCGAFLIGLVEYYKKKYGKSIKDIIRKNIYGSDILSYNIKRAKIILSIYGLLNDEIIEEDDFNIYHQDSLKAEWNSSFEIIVGNPPYVKYQDLSESNRSYLMNNFKTVKNGAFNLYFAFFELGFRALSSKGRLGYITPNNYFTSLAGISLRQYFSDEKCLYKVIDFKGEKVFNAQTYTAISFVDKAFNNTVLYDKINKGQSCRDFLLFIDGSINYLDNLNVKKWRLLKTQEQENIKIIETIGTPINKLFSIAVGIATLKDDVYFVNGDDEKDGLLKKVTKKGTFLIEKEVTRPVYKISNFKNQDDISNNTLRIITPYKVAGGSYVPILEEDFKANYPNCYEYLLTERDRLDGRDKGKVLFKPFYAWGRTQGISRIGKKILNPTFSKHPRFLFVPEEDAYYTNGYGIYFSKDDSSNCDLFDDLVHPLSKEENILVTQKILNSVVMDYYISATSISIQGGYPCYQKNFIERFTIPKFEGKDIDKLKKMWNKNEIDAFLIKKYQLNIPVPNRAS